MKLIKQLIEKKIELYEDFMLNRRYLRAISMFYSAYNISLAVLNLKVDIIALKKRNQLWRKWLLNYEEIDEKKFKIIHKFIQEDMSIIIQAFNFIDKITEDMDYETGDIYKLGMVGILSYELEVR